MNPSEPVVSAEHIVIGGRVQGVGFRPFVYRLAHRLGLRGWVRNQRGKVEILALGPQTLLDSFVNTMLNSPPFPAQPFVYQRTQRHHPSVSGFEILPSTETDHADVHVPPDYSVCDDCVREMHDPGNRRYRHPFINCTQCGPRYTLMTALPYDRSNTTMAGFAPCPACREEYQNSNDRRFHAQAITCPECGPQLVFAHNNVISGAQASLAAAISALRAGEIVAVKGIGGYHLLCDARNDAAVLRLRANKHRPHKPLAVLLTMQDGDRLNEVYRQALHHPARPIVLVPRDMCKALSDQIAPGLNEVGVFLPYSPLHHLLIHDFDGPLVATSANISGEPVITDNADAELHLKNVADAFLHHDRPIVRPADDSVFRIIAGKPRPLRLGRGCTPLELPLPCRIRQPLLAVGGHMKNTIALAWDQRLVLSPHVGDLGTPRSQHAFQQTINDLQALYGISAKHIICDAHPHYAGSRWAKQTGLPVRKVLHHHAHASALAGEYPHEKSWLIFTWDGLGYSEDGTLWGGEALSGAPGRWRRVASFRPFHLPGGEQAGRAPWRSAAALYWEADLEWRNHSQESGLLHQAWRQRLNCPATSSVGRLFDAAAALTGLLDVSSYEGQGPMMLEAAAGWQQAEPLVLPVKKDAQGLWHCDWEPLLPMLMDAGLSVAQRAACFHASLAQALLDQVEIISKECGEFAVGLAGGVFQNRLLSETAMTLLQQKGYRVYFPEQIPCNDAGLSYGQIIEASALSRESL